MEHAYPHHCTHYIHDSNLRMISLAFNQTEREDVLAQEVLKW